MAYRQRIDRGQGAVGRGEALAYPRAPRVRLGEDIVALADLFALGQGRSVRGSGFEAAFQEQPTLGADTQAQKRLAVGRVHGNLGVALGALGTESIDDHPMSQQDDGGRFGVWATLDRSALVQAPVHQRLPADGCQGADRRRCRIMSQDRFGTKASYRAPACRSVAAGNPLANDGGQSRRIGLSACAGCLSDRAFNRVCGLAKANPWSKATDAPSADTPGRAAGSGPRAAGAGRTGTLRSGSRLVPCFADFRSRSSNRRAVTDQDRSLGRRQTSAAARTKSSPAGELVSLGDFLCRANIG